MAWLGYLLAPFVALPIHIKQSHAERTTHEYLQTLDSERLLSALSSALEYTLPRDRYVDQVFDKFATGTPSVWNQDCFERFLHAQYGMTDIISDTAPLLWHCIASAGGFPLPVVYSLDKAAFSRAFNLLVLQGFQLFGARRDGLERGFYMNDRYASVLPRAARIIYTCLTRSSPALDSSPSDIEAAHERTLQNYQDCIHLAQPLTYQCMKLVSHSKADLFRETAQRLHHSDSDTAKASPLHRVQYADFQALMGLLLLASIREDVWKEGATDGFNQRSADIYCSHLDFVSESIKQASELANVITPHLLGSPDEQTVPFAAFERLCNECPSFVFLFSQLWASIFAPMSQSVQPAHADSRTIMPTSLINCFSLLQPANLGEPHPQARFWSQELRLNLDLRASRNVLEHDSKTRQSLGPVLKVLTSGDHFHIVMVELATSDTGKWDEVPTLFIGPSDHYMQCTQPGVWSYVWRSSFIQLRPDASQVNHGRMVVDQTNLSSNLMRLRTSREDEVGETNVTIDFENRQLCITGPGFGGQNRKWTDLQCWRMPGTVYRVIPGPPGWKDST